MQRRTFLTGTAAWVGMNWLAPAVLKASGNAPKFAANPFALGVASGEPWEDSVVLWTRLAPDALNGGGMSPASVEVKWELASDEQMKNIVASGTAIAAADLGHAVHVEVFGLQPARWYWYRFMVGNEVSPVGRTRTAPAPGMLTERFNFAFASCQHYETGWYTAYKHMCEENLDLVVFLGDYIYEYGAIEDRVRKHNGPEIMNLNDYRNRYALYKSDALLQRAHAQFPWVVTWDDHEVANNYAGLYVPTQKTGVEARRAAAYQAFFEHMPLRPSLLRQGPYMELYRDLSFGRLLEMQVLDTRQYRTPQPCGDGTKEACAEVFDPQATILGRAQKRWLMRNLDRSPARWNVLAQQVMLTPLDLEPGPGRKFSMDKWAGYNVETKQLMQFLATRKPSNVVVLSGDIHSNWVTALKADYDRPESAVLGAEFTGTSISSAGDGMDTRPTTERLIAENPHLKFYNGQRGYVCCAVTPEKWQTDFRVVPFVTKPDAPVSTRASFVVENGRPGAKQV
ncbi:MAG: alkaline phosphatase D family protein [Acidobacteria bacterium]|nr:alkaline phosphatase D family protein [Acidobacteriota bacterium]MBI3422314.1 alkaline phosphatase D family protein [Acidobacteriota bacterium]